jgi:signal transduction histidine kinase
MVTFARFLEENVDSIVDEFETFARTSGPAAEHLSSRNLRDHAKLMLQAIAADMAAGQSPTSRHDKAEGRAPWSPFSRVTLTGRQHAQHRFQQGFTLPQMLSEYRALRASVIRRWTAQLPGLDAGQVDELTRFGEAVDEGLTEAIGWYSKRLEDSRNLLVGVLAHDLRAPLSAVRMSAEYLLRTDRLGDGELRAATRIVSSTTRMAGYVSDLLDFTQTLLGAGLPVARTPLNLASLCEEVVDELRAAHPNAVVLVDVQAAPSGSWDASRLSQLLSNLVTNAIIHGDATRPVTVSLNEADGMAVLAVHNEGTPIPTEALPTLFQPLMQEQAASHRPRGSSGLGLGLYIAREIAVAHAGTLRVNSAVETGTVFTARLPISMPASNS